MGKAERKKNPLGKADVAQLKGHVAAGRGRELQEAAAQERGEKSNISSKVLKEGTKKTSSRTTICRIQQLSK